MEDGWYRLVTKEGTDYDIVSVEDGLVHTAKFPVYSGDPVQDFIDAGLTFTRVYPVALPDEMWDDIHNEALVGNISDDDVVETAIRNFFIYFRPAPEYRKGTK